MKYSKKPSKFISDILRNKIVNKLPLTKGEAGLIGWFSKSQSGASTTSSRMEKAFDIDNKLDMDLGFYRNFIKQFDELKAIGLTWGFIGMCYNVATKPEAYAETAVKYYSRANFQENIGYTFDQVFAR